MSDPGDKAPLRQRIKEWGEAVDVWTKVTGRIGLVGFGIFNGGAVIELLEKLIG